MHGSVLPVTLLIRSEGENHGPPRHKWFKVRGRGGEEMLEGCEEANKIIFCLFRMKRRRNEKIAEEWMRRDMIGRTI